MCILIYSWSICSVLLICVCPSTTLFQLNRVFIWPTLCSCYRTPFLSCSFLSTQLQPAPIAQSAWGHLSECSACETECETRAPRSQTGLKDDLVWPASQDISAKLSLTGLWRHWILWAPGLLPKFLIFLNEQPVFPYWLKLNWYSVPCLTIPCAYWGTKIISKGRHTFFHVLWFYQKGFLGDQITYCPCLIVPF